MTGQAFSGLKVGDVVRSLWWYGRKGGVTGAIVSLGDDPVWGRWIWIVDPALGYPLLFTCLDADDLEKVI